MSNWVEDFFALNPDAVKEEVDTKKKKKESTLGLDRELPAMDYRNMDFYNSLTPDEKKEISLWLLMRFMSSSQKDPIHHLLMVNDVVNVNFSVIAKHPELQWKLLVMCGTKTKQFHPWVAPPKGAKKNKLEEAVLGLYPLMKDDELELFLQVNTKEELEEFFKDNGFDDKTIKELFKGDKGK